MLYLVREGLDAVRGYFLPGSRQNAGVLNGWIERIRFPAGKGPFHVFASAELTDLSRMKLLGSFYIISDFFS
jgi:hypothetical protein